jgi:hypothetical protein
VVYNSRIVLTHASLMACWALCACACALAPAEEPYAELSGGKFIAGHGAPMNPDPLRDYVWNTTAMPNASALQLYRALPAAVHASPGANFTNAASLLNSSAAGGPRARALGGGTLVLDFGVELAAWLELRSPDLAPAAVAAGCVSMSVGESSVPLYFAPARLAAHVHNASNPLFAGWKTERPAPYAGGVFRLELNDQLYEGMRYGFLHVNASCGCFEAFSVESVVALAQVKPANWAGRFAAPGNPVLERAWYVGGYTVKLNLQEDAIGSILDQRGDRTPKGAFVGFAGDAHAAQAASMAAFGNFGLVRSMQQQLGQFDAVYGTYCMYWVLSLADFFAATADAAAAREMLPQAHEKMRRSFNRAVPKPGALVNQKTQYAGWDERFNFAKLPVYPENGYVMRAVRAGVQRAGGGGGGRRQRYAGRCVPRRGGEHAGTSEVRRGRRRARERVVATVRPACERARRECRADQRDGGAAGLRLPLQRLRQDLQLLQLQPVVRALRARHPRLPHPRAGVNRAVLGRGAGARRHDVLGGQWVRRAVGERAFRDAARWHVARWCPRRQ